VVFYKQQKHKKMDMTEKELKEGAKAIKDVKHDKSLYLINF